MYSTCAYVRVRVLLPDGLHLLMGQASQLSVARAPVMGLLSGATAPWALEYFASEETDCCTSPAKYNYRASYAHQHGHTWEYMRGSRKAKKETRCRLGFVLMRGYSPVN